MLTKKQQRLRRSRQTRIRIATQGVARLTVNRTNLHIYASVISGDGGKVLASASTAEAEVRTALGGSGKGGNTAAAQAVGKRVADYKVPKKILFMDEIPKGATGKLQRIGLAQKLGLG